MRLFLFHMLSAWQSLKSHKKYAFTVVVTLGLTFGVLTSVLTLTHVTMIKPLPYPEQHKLTYVEHQLINNNKTIDGRAFTYPNLIKLYQDHQLFENAIMMYVDGDIITSLPEKPMVEITYATPEWFTVFDANFALGHGFSQHETLNNYNPVAVISYQTWQSTFNASANILDQFITVSGKRFQIIGVLAQDYIELDIAYPGFSSDVILPWDFNSVSERERKRWGNDDGSLTFIGVLPDTVSPQQASTQLTTLINENWQKQVADNAFFKDWGINIAVKPIKKVLFEHTEQQLYLLVLSAIGLALIAAVNILNLFLARTNQQAYKLAITAAVGASKRQIISLNLAEITLLLFTALLLSQCIAFIAFEVMQQQLQQYFARIQELALSQFSVALSITLFLILKIVFTVVASKTINYHDLASSIKTSGKGNSTQISSKIRKILITSQITIASFLIFTNALLFLNAYTVVTKPLGYQTDNIHSLVFSMTNSDSQRMSQDMLAIKQEILAQPSVLSVSQSQRPTAFFTLALTELENKRRHSVGAKDIDNNYFEMIEQPIIQGENFTEVMHKDRLPYIIINDVFAEKLSPTGNAVGLQFENNVEVIGVVKSVIVPGKKQATPRFYFLSRPSRNMLLIKTLPNQSLPREQLLAIVNKVNSQINIFSYAPIEQYKNNRLHTMKITAVSTFTLMIITFFLCGIGLYGILSFSSQQRKFEIGTRLAVGAQGGDIIKQLYLENLAPFISGIAISTLALLAIGFIYKQAWQEFTVIHLIYCAIASISVVLLLSMIASYLPIRQYINQPVVHTLRASD